MKSCERVSPRNRAVTKRTVNISNSKHWGARTSTDATLPRRQRTRDLRAPPVDPVFESSMMAKVEHAAAGDPDIAAVLAKAKRDPAELLAAADRDPTVVKSLASFFVQQMANDPSSAMEFAKILAATSAQEAAPSVEVEVPMLVTSDSDNIDLSSCDLSSSDDNPQA